MKKLFCILFLALLINAASGIVYKNINVTTPGTLSTLLAPSNKATITDLTITGTINDLDIKCMRDEMPALSVLNINAVTIVEYIGTEGTYYKPGYTSFPTNEMPTCSFYEYPSDRHSTIKTVILPNSITSIGTFAFEYCSKLSSIIIPNSVTMIGGAAFRFCSGITVIKSLNSIPPILDYQTFTEVTPTAVYVPVGSVEAYKAAPGWKDFTNIVENILTAITQPAASITLSTVVLNAQIDINEETPVTAHGFCWNTSGSPTLADSNVDNGAKTTSGIYSNTISGLSPATTYYVKAYATNGERTVYGSEVTFSTSSLPVAAGVIAGDVSICQGENSVSYTVPSIDYATSYSWTLPSGATGTSTTNSITVNYPTAAASGNITVKGHNELGDGATSTLAVTVNQLPVVIGRDTALTCGGSVPLFATINYTGNGSLKYKWTPSTGLNNDTIQYPVSNVSSNITYTITVTTPAGCMAFDNVIVTVNPLTVNAGTDKLINKGDTAQLGITTNFTGNGKLKYKWTPATGLSNDTIVNPTSIVSGNITYTVTVTSLNGCTATDNVSVNFIPIAGPVIGIVGVSSSNKNRVVWNKPVSLGIKSFNIYRETSISDVYEKIGTVPYDSMSIFVDDQSFPDVKSSKYKLSIYDRSGIESLLSTPHKTMHLAINKGMNTTWNLIWEPYEGFNVLTYNIYRGTNESNLSFINNTSGSSTQYSDMSAPSGNVYYQLEVINQIVINPTKATGSTQKTKNSESMLTSSTEAYSSSRSNKATNVISGISKLEGENNISIYPNPVKNELRIEYDGITSFEILNLMGQVVYNDNLTKSILVRTSNLSSGVYLIKFKMGNRYCYKKIIKE